MSATGGLLIALPDAQHGAAPLRWWRMLGNTVVERGTLAAGNAADSLALFERTDGPIIALLPPADTVIHTHDLPDLTDRQAEAAAIREAAKGALGDPARLHTVATSLGDGEVRSITIDADLMQQRIDALGALAGPDTNIMPAGLLLPRRSEHPVGLALGDVQIIRSGDVVLAGDDPLLPSLVDETTISHLDTAESEAILAAVLASPPMTLRTGRFAPRTRRTPTLSRAQAKTLAALAAALLIISIAIPMVQTARLNSAADAAERNALEMTGAVAPNATDLRQAEAALDRQLAAAGLGGSLFTAPASTLFDTVRNTPQARLNDLRYTPDGQMTASLTANDSAGLNAVLQQIQARGFVVSEPSEMQTREDGSVMISFAMRAP